MNINEKLNGEWKPIDTAPKDGTKFLATDGFGNYLALSFYEWFNEDEGDPCWCSHHGDYCSSPPEPTHWTELIELLK